MCKISCWGYRVGRDLALYQVQVDRNLMLFLPRLAVLVRIEADRPGAWFPGPLVLSYYRAPGTPFHQIRAFPRRVWPCQQMFPLRPRGTALTTRLVLTPASLRRAQVIMSARDERDRGTSLKHIRNRDKHKSARSKSPHPPPPPAPPGERKDISSRARNSAFLFYD